MAWPAVIAAIASVMGTVANQQGQASAQKKTQKFEEQSEARRRRDKAYETQRANLSERGESQQQGMNMLLNSFQRALKR